jgi:hypothetical protein
VERRRALLGAAQRGVDGDQFSQALSLSDPNPLCAGARESALPCPSSSKLHCFPEAGEMLQHAVDEVQPLTLKSKKTIFPDLSHRRQQRAKGLKQTKEGRAFS